MARITKYLLLALIVAVAFNHAANAQDEPAAEGASATAEAGTADEEAPEAAPPAEEVAPAEGEPEVGSAFEEDNYSLGSIKKIGSWLSKFGWWNIWKGVGLKKVGDWWKWDKIFKEDWWKKKWFLLGSPLEEEESRMMLVLSDPEARSMGITAEEDATYFLAPPGFENELAKRGVAVNPSIVPVSKKQKKQRQRPQQQPQQRPQPQQQPQLQQYHPHQLQNTQYTQSWLQRAFPSLDVYDRDGAQGSEIDSVRLSPNTQSLSRSMVASLRQRIPDIIPLGSSAPNTPMYAYDKNGLMQLLPQQTPSPSSNQQYQMMNEDTQNSAVLQEYQQARTGYQELVKTKNSEIPKHVRANSKTEPERLIVPMHFPRSNSISTKEEIERALNDEQTQKMLEQYARKNWKTIRKDAIILKFVPKVDMEAHPSVKRQATMMEEQMPMPLPTMPRQMTGDQLPEQINSAYAKDFHQWATQQERAMEMQDQQQQFRQVSPPQMQPVMEQQPREETRKPTMQQAPMMQQEIPTPQEPRQSFNDQTSITQQQIPINHNQQHAITQQEPRQWLQEQPIMQQMPRQLIQEQPQQQDMMIQQEPAPQNEPRQWVQEQQWMSVDPSILDEIKPRQMAHQAVDQTQNTQPQQAAQGLTISDGGTVDNKDEQHPIVSEMGPQTEDNARFFKKVLLKSKPSSGAHYVTHNYNIYSSGGGHGSGGYGGGYGGGSSYGGSSYGRGASYDAGSSSGYESSHSGGYGEQSYGSQGAGYGGNSGSTYGSSGYSGSYGGDHSSSYGGGHHGGYGTGGSSGYESSSAGGSSYGSQGAGYGGSSGSSYGSSGYGGHSYGSQAAGYGASSGSSYGSSGHGGHSSYGSQGVDYGASSGSSYGSSGSYGGGHGGSYGGGHAGSYGAGHGGSYGSSSGGGHGGGYRTAEIGETPIATIF